MNVLELDRASYTYPGAARASLQEVSLEVGPGELVLVAGASGAGKSTLLRTASGLVPHFHGGTFRGRVLVAGMDTREHGPGELARTVGTLFQDPETQVVMGTVRAELSFPLENRGDPAAAVARGVEETALALGIAHLLDRPTGELSGGELQRVALGAALAGRPSLIVLDEPTSQLDPVAGDELISLLRRLNEDFDVAIVIAEHRLERCLAFVDRVVVLDRGQIVCDAAPPTFLEWAATNAPALQTPGARLLHGLRLPPVAGVRRARAQLRAHDLLPAAADDAPIPEKPSIPEQRDRARGEVLRFDRLWHEIREGPVILRGLSLSIRARERVALMGRNGAGKSTLLKHAAGLLRPTRGSVRTSGRVALLLQNPNDYLVHDTVGREASAQALRALGLAALTERHPRELSAGERQRLALAIVIGEPDDPPALLCLDEPTRGMGRDDKHELARMLGLLDSAVLVATHDPEFASAFAERVVLLADGVPVADGPSAKLLAGGTYFATETARILGGAGGALTPEQGIALVQRVTRTEAIA